MKSYFKFPKWIILIWRQLRVVTYLPVIFCSRGILMEIWVFFFFFFSNSLPFILQNNISTCLILSVHTIFKGFDIFLNNFIPTWPPPHQLPIPETAQGQETAARLRSETLAAPLGTPTALSPTLPPPALACPMPSCSLKLSTGKDPGHLLCHLPR